MFVEFLLLFVEGFLQLVLQLLLFFELERERENVNEAMYRAGYTDIKAFRTTFKKLTGLSPLEYKNKYSKGAITV